MKAHFAFMEDHDGHALKTFPVDVRPVVAGRRNDCACGTQAVSRTRMPITAVCPYTQLSRAELPYWNLHDIYIPAAAATKFAAKHYEFTIRSKLASWEAPIVKDFVIRMRQEPDVAAIQAHKANGPLEEPACRVVIGGNQKPLPVV